MTRLAALAALLVAALPAPARAQDATLAGRTHNHLMPSGELVEKGDAQVQILEMGLLNTVAFGVNDKLELSMGAPLVGQVVTAGARVQVFERSSPYRLAIGVGAFIPLEEEEPVYYSTATAAYQTDGINAHGTIGFLKQAGDGTQVGILSAGVTVKAGRATALTIETFRVTTRDTTCDADAACPQLGEPLAGTIAGVKFLGSHWDTDLGMLVVHGEHDLPALPVVSFTYRN